MIEVLKQLVDALEKAGGTCLDEFSHREMMSQPDHFMNQAIQAGKQAIAELESQEPVAYINVEKRRLEFAHEYVKWDTPMTIKLDKIPLYTHLTKGEQTTK